MICVFPCYLTPRFSIINFLSMICFKKKIRQLFSIDGLYLIGAVVDKDDFLLMSQRIYNVALIRSSIFNASHLIWDLYYRKLWFYALTVNNVNTVFVSYFLKLLYFIYLVFEFFYSSVFFKKQLYKLQISEPLDNFEYEYYAYSDENRELLWFYNIVKQKHSVGKLWIVKSESLSCIAFAYLLSSVIKLKILYPYLPLWQIIRSTSLRDSAVLFRDQGVKLLMEECADRNQTAILAGMIRKDDRDPVVFVRSPFMIALNYLGAKVVVPNRIVQNLMRKSNENVISIGLPFVHYKTDVMRMKCKSNETVVGYGPEMYSIVTSKIARSGTDNLINSLPTKGKYEILVRRHPQERQLSSLYFDCYEHNRSTYNARTIRFESLPMEEFFESIDIWVSPFSTTIFSALQNGCPVIAFRCVKSSVLSELSSMSCGLLRIVDTEAEFFKALCEFEVIIKNTNDLNCRIQKTKSNIESVIAHDYIYMLETAVSKAISS